MPIFHPCWNNRNLTFFFLRLDWLYLQFQRWSMKLDFLPPLRSFPWVPWMRSQSSLAILVSHSTWYHPCHVLIFSPWKFAFSLPLNREPSEQGRCFIHSGWNSHPGAEVTWEMLVDWLPNWWNNWMSFREVLQQVPLSGFPCFQLSAPSLHLLLLYNLSVLCPISSGPAVDTEPNPIITLRLLE